MAWREDWLDEARVSVYPKILIALYVVLSIGWIALSTDFVDRSGKPLGYDFITFWAASDLALHGHAGDVFDPVKIFAAQQRAIAANESVYLWHYPPVFLLFVLPLALVPYLVSCTLFVGTTLAIYIAYMKRLVDSRHTIWVLLAFPAVFVNLMHGQNGFMTATLIAAGCLALERRPILAGILIGALCYKPHFGLLFPLVLLAGRYWIAFASAAVTAAVICGAATLVFGIEGWVGFVDNLSLTRHVLEMGFLPWHKMPTLFASLRMLDFGLPAAYAAQFLGAAAATLITVHVWYRRLGTFELRAALLSVALLLISPYSFDYDLVILALPIALLVADGLRRGWMPGVRTVLITAYFMPLVLPGIAEKLSLQLMPFVLLALFATIRWRIGMAPQPQAVLAAA